MIFPYLNGILAFYKAPVTWCLVLINAFVMLLCLSPLSEQKRWADKMMGDEYYISTQGWLYAQYIRNYPHHYSPLVKSLSQQSLEGLVDKRKILGAMALRDDQFLQTSHSYNYEGDKVAIVYWQEKTKEVLKLRELHPSYLLGLTSQDVGLSRWFSYIFVHSGFVHFAGNMIFLIIFGCMLEPLIGGLALAVLFLLSGMVAAGMFLLVTGATSAPLIGASGAVSGLMALFCCLYWRRNVPYIYLLLPIRGYAGFVYLPAWITLFMWLGADLAGYWSSLREFGGVAYTAHLGGQMTGLLTGIMMFALGYHRRHLPPASSLTQPKLGKMIPFIQ